MNSILLPPFSTRYNQNFLYVLRTHAKNRQLTNILSKYFHIYFYRIDRNRQTDRHIYRQGSQGYNTTSLFYSDAYFQIRFLLFFDLCYVCSLFQQKRFDFQFCSIARKKISIKFQKIMLFFPNLMNFVLKYHFK